MRLLQTLLSWKTLHKSSDKGNLLLDNSTSLRKISHTVLKTSTNITKVQDSCSWSNTLACCRHTPLQCPNSDFIALLERVRLHCLLVGDDYAALAYAATIAAIKSYPKPIRSSETLAEVPRCDKKLLKCFSEYTCTNSLTEVNTFEASPKMRAIESL